MAKSGGNTFKGAVFDLDGLLMDSEPVWRWAQQIAFTELGLSLSETMQHATTGLRLFEAVVVWKGYFPEADLDPEKLRSRLVGLVAGTLRDSGQPKPGAIRALEICAQAGCRMAIASSSAPEVIHAALDRLDSLHPGAKGWFREILSAEGEIHGKPHPAVYLSAAARLGVEPRECIAFEDSVFGLKSAHAAGMHCVAVPEAHNRGRTEYAIAHRILDSLETFKPEYLSP
ncbi:MAG: 2-deoxyglucose-6-phosphatase [Fibrobacteres bacterium]|nr:2-deoxyglucose-6-phosphatase [Fibrobacterota bacterium]